MTTTHHGLGVHVIQNPAGTFSLVGSIPHSLCTATTPTRADVLGCRVDHPTGLVYRPRVYQTAAEAFAATDAAGFGCHIATCACAALRAS